MSVDRLRDILRASEIRALQAALQAALDDAAQLRASLVEYIQAMEGGPVATPVSTPATPSTMTDAPQPVAAPADPAPVTPPTTSKPARTATRKKRKSHRTPVPQPVAAPEVPAILQSGLATESVDPAATLDAVFGDTPPSQ